MHTIRDSTNCLQMVRKSQRLKNSAEGNTSNHSVVSQTDEDEFECNNCDVIFATTIEKQAHEESCEFESSTNFFVTSDGKTRFVCSVNKKKC